MIQLTGVVQFVEDDIIPYPFRALDKTPIEGNVLLAGARTPAGFLVPDCETVIAELESG